MDILINKQQLSNNCYYLLHTQNFFEIAQLISQNPIKYGAMLRASGRKAQPHAMSRPRQLYAWMLNVLPENVKCCGIAEQCYWLLNGLIEFPKCKTCGKQLSSKNFHGLHKGYAKFCSQACLSKDPAYCKSLSNAFAQAVLNDPQFNAKRTAKSLATRQRKYGAYTSYESIEKRNATRQQKMIENPNYLNEIYEKTKMTKIANGHLPTWNNAEKMKQTRLEKNGGLWETEETLQKRKHHALEKYGVDDANKSDIVKQHKAQAFQQKYGNNVKTSFQTPQFKAHMKDINEQRKQKEFETKRRNKTFSTSIPEEKCYHMLHFIYPHIVRQYKSNVYPFACDFYDPDSNIYFEYNGSWTHGGHFFNPSNKNDQETLKKWRDKDTKFYQNAIQTWTIRDVLKRQTAIANNLNYVVFWNLDEVMQHALSVASK